MFPLIIHAAYKYRGIQGSVSQGDIFSSSKKQVFIGIGKVQFYRSTKTEETGEDTNKLVKTQKVTLQIVKCLRTL